MAGFVAAAPLSLCLFRSRNAFFGPKFHPLKHSKQSSDQNSTRFVSSLPCVCANQGSRPDREYGSLAETSGCKELLRWTRGQAVKTAFAIFTAGILIMSPVDLAFAGKSGGRVGGQTFRSAPVQPPRAAPRINNSGRANIFINPPPLVAPPLYGGYGAPFFGGWGWSPFSFFVPGPSIAIGVGGGFEFILFLFFIGMVGSIINFFRQKDNDDFD
eukprot:c13006_g1_i1 orf=134-775(+)